MGVQAMKPEVIVGLIISVIGIICTVCAYYKGLKTDTYNKGSTDTQMKSDIEYIKRRNDDILLEQKDTNKNFFAFSERITRVEESAKQAHKRIDRIEGKEKE